MDEEKKKCRACKELIWADATTCPKCRTIQNRQLHKKILIGLKEFSSITVIFSLIFAVVELNKFADSWFENSNYAERLANSASLLVDSGDFIGARKLLADAKEIYPASHTIGVIQKDLAMISIREIVIDYRNKNKNENLKIIQDSLYSLYRSLGKPNSNDADTLAHIAWGTQRLRNYNYGSYESVDINTYLEKALTIDPSSYYANIYKGIWYLNSDVYQDISKPLTNRERVIKAQQHFEIALEKNINSSFVRRFQLSYLDYMSEHFSAYEYIKIATAMHSKNDIYLIKNKKEISENLRNFLYESIDQDLKNNKIYIENTFLSLNDQEINSVKELLKHKSINPAYVLLLKARINEKKSSQFLAIQDYIKAYLLVKNKGVGLRYKIPKLINRICTSHEDTSPKTATLCDEFNLTILDKSHARS